VANPIHRICGAIIAAAQMNIPCSDGGVLLSHDAPASFEIRRPGLLGGGTVGFEPMDNQKFGTRPFANNYQRALEVRELARSISTGSSVHSGSACVHPRLQLKPSLLQWDQKSCV
jgi:hypothetical protein